MDVTQHCIIQDTHDVIFWLLDQRQPQAQSSLTQEISLVKIYSQLHFLYQFSFPVPNLQVGFSAACNFDRTAFVSGIWHTWSLSGYILLKHENDIENYNVGGINYHHIYRQ